ncbi:LOW QUALITY PROTEIN: BAG family molecular chaperone regulator 7-like [Juglans microcarpa x Juglans regia]|uniref:LOW QUALITY PROTEIN: BAG family molecular chaperone regulator 7-like n=1 Tax=Juglans microcarpa x Juglans regia TaxID=2249226 RepID=UPI001B7E880D|nr:LOW QUALITY PROTEIN: BAG family molecular chaperone regulator 7-like [Juglans microcarpa x Juglans regia]
MSRRFELIEPSYYPPLFLRDTSIFAPKTLPFPFFVKEDDLDLDLPNIYPGHGPIDFFETVTDLVCFNETPSFSSYRRLQRFDSLGAQSFYLQSLSDRVSLLESRFDRLLSSRSKGGDRKYTWTAEIKSPENDGVDRKYKWTTEIKEGRKEKGGIEKNYKWSAEINGRGEGRPIERTYTFKASSGDADDHGGSKRKEVEKKKKKTKGESDTRLVEIEEPVDHGAVVLRQAFAKRVGAIERSKGKKKELSPHDAALMIQMSFRAYLIRRSQVLRALRDLAVAKTKLKEIRALFNNFSYRRRVAQDAEERQRFSERIIVLLLTVDAIEGADLMVRAAKRSMVDELEAMLDVVDPQPPGKSPSMRRRTFDMPDGVIQKEIAAGVARVVQMLNREEESANAIEASL